MTALPGVCAAPGGTHTPVVATRPAPGSATHANRAMRVALLAALVVSGASALVYQVVWQRQLAALFGGDAAATAMMLAVLFAGIGAGSAQELGFVRAGEILYRALVAIDQGDDGEARRLRDAFRDLVPYGTYEMFAGRLARADRVR